MVSYTVSCRAYWKTRWSGCRAESCPAVFKYCWVREMASVLPLRWLVDGGKCSVGLNQWKKTNWQCWGKPSGLLKCGKTWLPGKRNGLYVQVHHVDAHVPKSWAVEENCNNEQVNQVAKVKLPQVDYFWLSGQPMTPHVTWKEMQHYRWPMTMGWT